MKAAIKQFNQQQNQGWFWWRMAYFQLGVVGRTWSALVKQLVPMLMKKWDELINAKSDEIDKLDLSINFEAVVLVVAVKKQSIVEFTRSSS